MNLLMSFLGGGLVAALLNWVRVARSERRTLKADRTRAQLEKLYGPLFFVTAHAKRILELTARHSEGYRIEYIDASNGTSEEMIAAIDVNNRYASELHELAKEASTIMRGAYSYIDPQDSCEFQNIVIDALRLSVEREDSGKMKTPIEIYKHVGEMYFFRESFVRLIERRFGEMRKELIELET